MLVDSSAMDTEDTADTAEKKRKHEAAANDSTNKRQRTDVVHPESVPTTAAIPSTAGEPSEHLQRDREHTTVFVDSLPEGVTEADIRSMFKDCGEIREIVVTDDKDGELFATVEFMDRESVPAALTKDKKKIKDVQIQVQMAWKSTLFVTNFPETADDAWIRERFGKVSLRVWGYVR